MEFLPLPNNIGKRRWVKDIYGNIVNFIILDEIRFHQTDYPIKAIYLQKMEFLEDHRIQVRLGYYIIGKKERMRGKWVWGQYATMLPLVDFIRAYREASEKGWFLS